LKSDIELSGIFVWRALLIVTLKTRIAEGTPVVLPQAAKSKRFGKSGKVENFGTEAARRLLVARS